MDYSALISGSPLIPLDIVATFGLAFLALILAVKTSPAAKLARFLSVTAAALIFLTLSGSLLAFFWLIKSPQVIKTDPLPKEENYPAGRKIEIVFDRPVSRAILEKSISPEVPGVWVFENSTYRTHLMRRVVFYPRESLSAATEYTVSLKNIRNVLKKSAPYNYELKFKTQAGPKVSRVLPGNNQKDVAVTDSIQVYLSAPHGQVSQLEFELSPSVPFSVSLDQTGTLQTLTPKEPLRQGTRYQLQITKSDVRRNLTTGEVVETGPRQSIYNGYFTTKIPVGIASIFPTGDSVTNREPVTIRFSKAMDKQSVLANFSIEPPVEGSSRLIDNLIFVFTPRRYDYQTTYTIKLAKGTKSLDGSFLDSGLISSFTTLGKVKIESSFPKNDALGVTPDTPLSLTFDQAVDQPSVESRFSTKPATAGKFSWQGRTLTFIPAAAWQKNTLYTVTLKSGLKSLDGLDSTDAYSLSFSTVQSVFKLAVPVYLQQHALSCELAALRMVLSFRQIQKTEEELLAALGNDQSPRRGNIWGDPYSVFVGNVDGRQMSTGYGVYWPAIARVANGHRTAREFSGLSLADILQEVEKGNPVIIWTYSKSGLPTFWFTSSGEKIFAAAGEHTVVIVGFVGPVENPSQIIVNDPLLGQLYWSTPEFMKRTSLFANSGVIVY